MTGRADPESIALLEKAANLGDTRAPRALGVSLLQKGDPDGVRLLEQVASDRDDPVAWFALGKVFHEGRIVPADGAVSRKWLGMAAAKGHSESQRLLKVLDKAEAKANAAGAH